MAYLLLDVGRTQCRVTVGLTAFAEKLKTYFLQPRLLLLQDLLQRIPFQPLRLACFSLFLLDQIPMLPLCSEEEGSEIRPGCLDDIEELLRCENKREIFLRRFQAGERCLVALRNGRIVGYEWFSPAPVHLEERYRYPIKVPSDTLYVYDAYVTPEFRRQGVWRRLMQQILHSANQSGRKKVLLLIDCENEHSMRLHLRLGFYPVKRVLYFRLCGITFFREEKISKTEFPPPPWTL